MTLIKRNLRVFLCHASDDKSFVNRFYSRLVNDGVEAWLDKEKLIPGQNWEVEISNAVKNSDVFIVFLSSKSITKEGFVQKEIKFALDIADEKPEDTIFIIPARLENCNVPRRLSKFHWVDLYTNNGYEQLLKALQIRATSIGAVLLEKKSSSQQLDIEKIIASDEKISAKEWAERGKQSKSNEDKIYYYSQSIKFGTQPHDISEAYLSRGVARQNLDDIDGALGDFNEALRIKESDRGYALRGSILEIKKDFRGALKDYNKCIRWSNWESYARRAHVYEKIGDFENAIKDWSRAENSVSSFYDGEFGQEEIEASYRSRRGMARLITGDTKRARQDLEHAVYYGPHNGLHKGRLARTLRQLGKQEEANKLEEEGRKLMESKSKYNQACFEALCGKDNDALDLLKSDVELNPHHRELAKLDVDFFYIRNHQNFREIVS